MKRILLLICLLTFTARAQTSNTVYASQCGAALNSDLTTGGGADDTVAIQSALDSATNFLHLDLVLDGVARVSGLKLSSNTRITCLPGCGLYLANGSNRPLITTQHRLANMVGGNWNPGGTATYESNIEIDGLIANFNGTNQAFYDSSMSGSYWLVGIELRMVTNVSVHDCTFINAKTFSLLLAGYKNAIVQNIVGHHDVPSLFQDVVHAWGPGRGSLVIDNVQGDGGDDQVALCIDEILSGLFAGGTSQGTWGTIDGAAISNIKFNAAETGIRLLCITNRMGPVTIQNVTGTIGSYAIHIGPNWPQYGPGNYSSVAIQNVSVAIRPGGSSYGTTDTDPVPAWNLINVEGKIDSLSIAGCVQDNSTDYRPYFLFGRDCNAGTVQIIETSIVDSNLTYVTDMPRIVVTNGARIAQLLVSDLQWSKPADSNVGRLISIDGSTVGSLQLFGVQANNLTGLVGGSSAVQSLLLEGVQSLGSSGASVTISGATLTADAYDGPALFTGTWGTVNMNSAGTNVTDYTTNLVAWYRFNETTGTLAADASGNGNHASLITSGVYPTRVVGHSDSGLQFNPTNLAYVVKHAPAGVPTGNAPFTLACWYRLTSTNVSATAACLFGFGMNSGTGTRYTLFRSGLSIGVEDAGGGASYAMPLDTRWHHLAAVWPGGSVSVTNTQFYIDGVFKTTMTSFANATPNIPASASVDISVGAISTYYINTTYTPFGTLDECRLYSTALTSNQVQQIYLAP